jgi:hypothetical protein
VTSIEGTLEVDIMTSIAGSPDLGLEIITSGGDFLKATPM